MVFCKSVSHTLVGVDDVSNRNLYLGLRSDFIIIVYLKKNCNFQISMSVSAASATLRLQNARMLLEVLLVPADLDSFPAWSVAQLQILDSSAGEFPMMPSPSQPQNLATSKE